MFYGFIFIGIVVWKHGLTFQSKNIRLNIISISIFRHLSSLPPISWTLAIWRICIQMYKSKIKPSRLKVVFLVYSTLAKYIMYFQYITCFSIKINFNVLNTKLYESVLKSVPCHWKIYLTYHNILMPSASGTM